MTEKGKTVGKHALTGALAAALSAAATYLLGHAMPSAQAAQPTEVAALRLMTEVRFDQLEKRLEVVITGHADRLNRLERAQDARAIPAGGR